MNSPDFPTPEIVSPPVRSFVETSSVYVDEAQGLLDRFRSGERGVVIKSGEGQIENIRNAVSDDERITIPGGSAHKVGTCVLSIQGSEGLRDICCVVKRHAKRGKGAMEWDNTNNVRGRGITTVEPVAFISGQQSAFFFSALDHDLRPASTINWRSLASSERESFLSRSAETFGQIHTQSIYHGDPQLKNVCFSRRDGQIYFFDWESSIVRSKPRIVDPVVMDSLLKDIGIFINSARIAGLFDDLVAGELTYCIENIFLTSYYRYFESFSSKKNTAVRDISSIKTQMKLIDWIAYLSSKGKHKGIINENI